MTIISFYTTEAGWQGFEAVGHTNWAVHGEDVVCAAVSALTQTTVLGLTEVLGIDCQLCVEETAGALLCLLPGGLSKEQWEQAQLILKVLYSGLIAIVKEAEYRKYVSVKEVPYRENESATLRLQKGWRKYQKWQRLSSKASRRQKS